MTDMLDDNQSRPYLSAAELRGVEIPEVRKGGYDRDIANEVLERAALTLDNYTSTIERLNSEREESIRQEDANASTDEPAQATRLLVAAVDTSERTVADAQAEADKIIFDATHATEALRAEAARLKTSSEQDVARRRAELEEELRVFRNKVSGDHDTYQAALDRWSATIASAREEIRASLSSIEDSLSIAASSADHQLPPFGEPGSTTPVAESPEQPAFGEIADSDESDSAFDANEADESHTLPE